MAKKKIKEKNTDDFKLKAKAFKEKYFKDENNVVTNFYTTDVTAIDKGMGGLVSNRLVEFFGVNQAGKTALAIDLGVQVQKQGGLIIHLDDEYALTDCKQGKLTEADKRMIGFGIDLDLVIKMKAMSFMDIMHELPVKVEAIRRNLSTTCPIVFIWDSWAGTLTQNHIEIIDNKKNQDSMAKESEENKLLPNDIMGRRNIISKECINFIKTYAANRDFAVIVINHEITDYNKYGLGYTSPGGTALKNFCRYRLRLQAPTQALHLTHDNKPYGIIMRLTYHKANNESHYKTEYKIPLHWKYGVDRALDKLMYCKEHKLGDVSCVSGLWRIADEVITQDDRLLYVLNEEQETFLRSLIYGG